jgi:mannose/cellobiose epimerase-like protein (N-acyl-D-glucosamine 2-epimerase family)
MCEAANALGDSQLKAQVEAQAIAMTETALKEGLDSNGAMRYEKEHGKFSPRMSWWPQCETIIGAVNAWQLTGNKKYFEAAQHTWDYVKAHFIDSKNGGWYKGLNTDGTPNREPKVSDWNCPYHNSRMAYELAERLNKGCQM